MRGLLRGVAPAAFLALCLAASTLRGASAGPAFGAPWPAAPGDFRELVDVGGRRLDVECSGEGSPTVVLDNALATPMVEWAAVKPALARLARVCSYDRAGVGRSDPGAYPRTSRDAVADLRALLTNAAIPGPYVLVGHGLGGMNVRLYAAEHPDEVVGLVLVDATHEDQEARLGAVLPPRYQDAVRIPRVNVERFEPEASYAQLRAAAPLRPMPLVVLTHGQYRSVSPRGLPADVPERLESTWRELQADLARRVPGGRQVIALGSGHNIQRDEPELVVEAVREVIAAGRRSSPTGLPPSGEPAGLLKLLVLAGGLLVGLGLALRRLGRPQPTLGGSPEGEGIEG